MDSRLAVGFSTRNSLPKVSGKVGEVGEVRVQHARQLLIDYAKLHTVVIPTVPASLISPD